MGRTDIMKLRFDPYFVLETIYSVRPLFSGVSSCAYFSRSTSSDYSRQTPDVDPDWLHIARPGRAGNLRAVIADDPVFAAVGVRLRQLFGTDASVAAGPQHLWPVD